MYAGYVKLSDDVAAAWNSLLLMSRRYFHHHTTAADTVVGRVVYTVTLSQYLVVYCGCIIVICQLTLDCDDGHVRRAAADAADHNRT